jgi:hypothetical protein
LTRSLGPSAGYAELDAKRTRFQDEVKWLDKQDKENIATGKSIQVCTRASLS